METEVIISASNIGCLFNTELQDPTERNTTSLQGIWVRKLLIPKTGITVITGKSGSGKSTLLGLLSRMRAENIQEKNRELYVHQNNRKISLLTEPEAVRGSMGFVFQEAHLLKSVSVRANAELACRAIGVEPSSKRIKELADLFEIDHLLDKPASKLSGGQAQRLSVLRALAVDPDILICDEPTSSLDDVTASRLMGILKHWSEAHGKAILWVTHNIGQAAEYSDYLIQVDEGRLEVEHNGMPIDLRQLSTKQKYQVISGEKEMPEYQEITRNISRAQSTIETKNNSKHQNNRMSWSFALKLSFLDIYSKGADRTTLNYPAQLQSSGPSLYDNIEKRRWEKSKPLGNFELLAPFRMGLTWVYLLGFVVVCMLSICWFTGRAYFNDKLNAPEVSHFTLTSYSELPLNYEILGRFNKQIKLLASSETTSAFGRREFPLKNVFSSKDEKCRKPSRKDLIGIPILIYQKNEPLFLKTFNSPETQQNTIKVTKDVIRLLSQTTNSGETPNILCVDIFGKYAPFSMLLAPENVIPGSLDQTYFAAIDDESYRDFATLANGERFKNTSFNRFAIYFDQSNNKEILCLFGALDDENNCDVPATDVYKQLKINKDVFNQLGSLTMLSTTANVVFGLLLAGFLCVLSISTALAVSDYIKSNQKSLAVLKAFGANRRFLTSLTFSNSLILQINSVIVLFILFSICYFIYSFRWIDVSQFDQFLDLGLKNVLISLGMVFGLSTIVIIALVLNWIRRNEYVAETLQQV